MKIEQTVWTPKIGWQPGRPGQLAETAQLVFVFGGTQLFKTGERLHEIRQAYPQAHFFGCSTAGEIAGTQVSDDSLVVTAIHFEHTQIKGAQITVAGPEESYQAGERLGQMLEPEGLVHEVLGAKTVLTGFYSYGEISPFTPNATCELHNQTMTITTWSEN